MQPAGLAARVCGRRVVCQFDGPRNRFRDMVVLDEDACMVDLAKHYLAYLKNESCGKCSTCREGLRRLYDLVDDVSQGKATKDTIQQIEEIADTVEAASLCALGTTSTYPLRSTLKYFMSEYEAHVNDKKCPSGVCM